MGVVEIKESSKKEAKKFVRRRALYWGLVSVVAFIICMLKYLAGAVAICCAGSVIAGSEISWQQVGRYFVVLMGAINLMNIAVKTIIAFCKNLAKDIDKRNEEKNNEKNEERKTEVW